MTVKVDSSQLKRRFKNLLNKIEDRDTFRALGFFVISTVRERTRKKGQGVKNAGGRASKLKIVSKAWAKRRVKEQRHPEAATGRKSNLTFKGTLLDSMIIKRADKRGLFIGFKNVKQEDKAEGQANQGRVFMNLSGKEIRSSIDFLKKEILRGRS